jgi:hypothetical protein
VLDRSDVGLATETGIDRHDENESNQVENFNEMLRSTDKEICEISVLCLFYCSKGEGARQIIVSKVYERDKEIKRKRGRRRE